MGLDNFKVSQERLSIFESVRIKVCIYQKCKYRSDESWKS